jgi:AAA family ATP:ADP antiporter
MSDPSTAEGPRRGDGSIDIGYRFLRLFADIRRGEASKVLLLALNVFLILMAYYTIKPIRDALIITAKGPEFKSYMGAAQAVLFIFVIKAFSRLASKVSRHILITWVTLFFISNLLVFNVILAGAAGDRGIIAAVGMVFYIWIGIFNMMVVAQFWGFANDLYAEGVGKRVFPLVWLGGTLGAPVGSKLNAWLSGPLGLYQLLSVSAAILGVCIVLAVVIHKKEVRGCVDGPGAAPEELERRKKAMEEPLKRSGGFRLVFRSRYLLLIAMVIGIYNFVNANGEYMIARVISGLADKAIQAGAVVGMSREQIVNDFFADYQFLTGILTILIQLVLVSRIFKWVGIRGALLFLPAIALFGYSLITFGATLVLLKWVKSLENGTDYSLMNTTKGALFLVTAREEKYKAKAAIDTFFVRGGDTLSALAVFLGTTYLAAEVESYAVLNVIMGAVWIALTILVAREYKKQKAASDAASGTA